MARGQGYVVWATEDGPVLRLKGAPERVLAAVLFNAAAGASFDQMLAAVAGPSPRAARTRLA